MAWEEFVDGAISLGTAVTLSDALATPEGEVELRELFNTIEPDEDGRTPLRAWNSTIKRHPDVMLRYLGLEARSSRRFAALFYTGRFDVWIGKCFRRMGLHQDDFVTWEEFLGAARESGL